MQRMMESTLSGRDVSSFNSGMEMVGFGWLAGWLIVYRMQGYGMGVGDSLSAQCFFFWLTLGGSFWLMSLL